MGRIITLLGVSLIVAGVVIGVTSSRGPTYYQTGIASWYGPNFAGNLTANGEIFDPEEMTAAHKSLPFNTMVRVVELSSGREVTVRINDRGPFIEGRIIDLSRRAAEKLGTKEAGIVEVGLQIKRWGD